MKVDVAIIGGGSTGASMAYNLAKNNAGKILLLEKNELTSGMTSLSGAIIRLHYSNAIMARLALLGWRLLKDMETKLGEPSGFVKSGVITAVSEKDRRNFETNVNLQRSIGIDTRLIDIEELEELQPGIETKGISSAAFEPESGYADPRLTTQTFAKKSVRARL